MIIVEGPDGGGKTTLVKQLSSELGIPLDEAALLSKAERNDPKFRSKSTVRYRVYKALSREVVGRKGPLLYDRLYFSDLIYSEAYGRECSFNWTEQLHVGRCLNAFKTPVIFCLPPFEEVSKHFVVDEQMADLMGRIHRVYMTYKTMGEMFMARKREFKPMIGKGGVNYSRTPRDYALPPVTWYDYTKADSYDKAKTRVLEYLSYRAMRSNNWTG